jgi:hypothetical protein
MSETTDKNEPVYVKFVETWKSRRLLARVYLNFFYTHLGTVFSLILLAYGFHGAKFPEKALLYLSTMAVVELIMAFATYIIMQMDEFRFKFLSEVKYPSEEAPLLTFSDLDTKSGKSVLRGAWISSCVLWLMTAFPFIRLSWHDARDEAVFWIGLYPIINMTAWYWVWRRSSKKRASQSLG